MSDAAPITCLVADDHPPVVELLSRYLDSRGVQVVSRVRDGEAALAEIEERSPDVALIDIRMPKLSGIEVARRAARSAPDTAIVLYTGFGERALLLEAIDVGVRGFVQKEAPLDELVRAITLVAAGGTYVDPVLGAALARDSGGTSLSKREREVLQLLAAGLTNEEIGKQLFISPETVRVHVRRAMERLNASTRTQAVAQALRDSLIS